MQLTHLLGVMLPVAVSLAVAVDGFAPSLSRLPKTSSHPPDYIKSPYNRNVIVNVPAASSMESMEIPSIEPRKTLNRVQSNIVKALMLAYIASMCIGLPL